MWWVRGCTRTVACATLARQSSHAAARRASQCVPQQLSAGSAILVASTVIVFVYCGVGAGMQWRKGERGRDLVPQRALWTEMADLIVTGFRFTFGKVKSTGIVSMSSRYEQL